MKAKLFCTVVLLWGIASASDTYHRLPYTKVTEREAESFVVVGRDQKEIIANFGRPNETDDGKDGVEMWIYSADPNSPNLANSGYSGFFLLFKNRKVTHLGILHPKL
jgi:hypothetical protein